MLTAVPGEGSGHECGEDGSPSLIDEIVREGAGDAGRGAAGRRGRLYRGVRR